MISKVGVSDPVTREDRSDLTCPASPGRREEECVLCHRAVNTKIPGGNKHCNIALTITINTRPILFRVQSDLHYTT